MMGENPMAIGMENANPENVMIAVMVDVWALISQRVLKIPNKTRPMIFVRT
jgi:hypothetical protein